MQSLSLIKQYILNKSKNKIVYRFISEEEKKAIENQNFEKIGQIWANQSAGNNHKYKKNIRYIHFIENKKDAKTIYKELGSIKDYFIELSWYQEAF